MARSDFEIPRFFIVENSKQRINFKSATNVPFWEPGSNFVIFKEPSKYSPCHLRLKRCCNENLLKVVKNWATEILKMKILKSGISVKKLCTMGWITLAYIVPKPTKVWYIELIEKVVK